ncbi:auxin-responsive protein IAA2-like [Argentina anserina]|uniref:auxin-responsive protein IAA2-like n=1 Tax=Argentina anserina TaxID=57926 RepID=UPI0021762601|nr:auxin-responsive protein IAA2-like [Potentilla anserina]
MGQLYNRDQLHVTEEPPVRANKRSCGVASEERKLELRLGPPGDQDRSVHSQLGFTTSDPEAKRVCHELQVKAKNEEIKWLANTAQHQPKSSYFKCPVIPQPDNKACSNPATASKFPIAAAANGSDEKSKSRITQAPVVGWPPVRSFRKNLANKSSLAKPTSDQSLLEIAQEESKGKTVDGITKEHMFVKINMEGVPIGRKVNLKAYDSYEKLSSAIDHLFQVLLAAQRDYSAVEKENKEETKAISDSYTLLYEDNEGDRMLVGDVPWNMFVSTAKRLRVLKSSELSTLRLNSSRHEKTPLESAMETGR